MAFSDGLSAAPDGASIGLSAFGSLIELIQMIPAFNRTADWSDLIADILTTAAVPGVKFVVRRIRHQAAG